MLKNCWTCRWKYDNNGYTKCHFVMRADWQPVGKWIASTWDRGVCPEDADGCPGWEVWPKPAPDGLAGVAAREAAGAEVAEARADEEKPWWGIEIRGPQPPPPAPPPTASYYRSETGHEALDVIRAWGLSFSLGNVVKYIARHGRKPGVEALDDLLKARDYLDDEIRHLRGGK